VTKITIAIDGPAASGKSTVGAALAAKLGYLYFDTGVMYRAVAWAALDRGILISDEEAVGHLAEILLIEVIAPTTSDGRQYTVLADKTDITWAIREPQVNRSVSPVSTYRKVRAALTSQQRRIGAPGAVVMVGRDIGTVVLPEAEVKVYLDATLEERTRRRLLEASQRGQVLSYEDVLVDLQRRDHWDSTRSEAPLSVAHDAVVVDTTSLTIEQVVARIEHLVYQAREFKCSKHA
jgi:CMP/dCMP kinase